MLNIKEDRNTEFKRELPTSSSFHGELAAFSNTEGGVLYIGVNDDGTINEKFQLISHDSIWNKIRTSTSPEQFELVQQIWRVEDYIDGETKLIKITCQISPEPIATVFVSGETVEKKYFVKFNNTKQQISFDDIQIRFSDQAKVNRTFLPSEFSELLKHVPSILEERHRKAFYIERSGFLTKMGSLFSNDECFTISFDNKKYLLWDIPNLILRIKEKFGDIVQVNFQKQRRIDFIGADRFENILRELVVNAIAHSSSKDISIEFSSASISVENSTRNDRLIQMVQNGVVDHTLINPHRMRLIKDLKYMEAVSDGYNSIIKNVSEQNEIITFLKKEGDRITVEVYFRSLLKYEGNIFVNELIEYINTGKQISSFNLMPPSMKKYFIEYKRGIQLKEGVKIW